MALQSVGNQLINAADSVNPSVSGNKVIAVTGTTTTALTSAPNPAAPSTAVIFTASVSTTAVGGPITGLVTFQEGATVLGTSSVSNGQATFSTTTLARGLHPITAAYSGDSKFQASTSAVYTQYITLAATAMSAKYSSGSPRVNVTWIPDSNATNCEIVRSPNINTSFVPVGLVAASATLFQDTTANANTTYLYRVRTRTRRSMPAISFARSIGQKCAHVSTKRSLIPNLTPVGLYTDPTLSAGTSIKRSHLTDLRNRVQ